MISKNQIEFNRLTHKRLELLQELVSSLSQIDVHKFTSFATNETKEVMELLEQEYAKQEQPKQSRR